MSKYTPLVDHLSRLVQPEVRLSFAEIEAIIGDELPPSAGHHTRWWANSRTADSHTWAHEWIAAGWIMHEVDLVDRWVVFQRAEDVTYFEVDSEPAREGYEIDRHVLVPARSAALAQRRRQADDYTCQACGLRLEVQGSYVIEVHHLRPLAA